MKFKTMLFDLDGTLVDTAKDLAFALNTTLINNDKPEKKLQDIRKFVSNGAKSLIQFGFNINQDDKNFKQYHQQLLAIYQQNIAKNSHLFIGMEKIIMKLNKWGIVTNKPEKLTYPLLVALNLKPDVVICGDTLNENKPSPKPILVAMKKLKIKNCAFVGDDLVDMQAGNAANITTIAVSYGYAKPQKNWNYDFLINKPEALAQWII